MPSSTQLANRSRSAKESNQDRVPGTTGPETSLNAFIRVPLSTLVPAKLNDKVYKVVDPKARATKALVKRMKRLGWIGAMAVTQDRVIVSGHRRRAAAMEAGITEVVVEVLPITSTDPRFAEYLVSYNEQRKKTAAEEIHEQVVLTDPQEAYARLIAYREAESRRVHDKAAKAGLCVLTPDSARKRSNISAEKRPMLEAAIDIINRYSNIWPLTLRQVHYRMLGLAVLRNASNKNSTYANDRASYQDLSKLLVRARLIGEVPFVAIEDETRPMTNWQAWDSPGPFVREQLDDVLCGYRRNLQQSQPAFIVLFVEKMTVQAIAERAAMPYHIPVLVGRGYPSLTAVHSIAEQFHQSDKDRMVLVGAGDHDPEGLNIIDRLAASLRDEFDVFNLTAVRAALHNRADRGTQSATVTHSQGNIQSSCRLRRRAWQPCLRTRSGRTRHTSAIDQRNSRRRDGHGSTPSRATTRSRRRSGNRSAAETSAQRTWGNRRRG